ncbi:MAG: hypothetical protein HQ518_26215 [Rhodopirellula sp.]|nr:hypothetical protein [Rhodopirellula sp.]
MNLMRQLWQDEAGVIVSTEIILIMMILVFGMIAGLVSFRDAVTQELADTGLMVNTLNQSYSFSGNTNTSGALNAQTPASVFTDETDLNDTNPQATGVPEGISLVTPAGAPE